MNRCHQPARPRCQNHKYLADPALLAALPLPKPSHHHQPMIRSVKPMWLASVLRPAPFVKPIGDNPAPWRFGRKALRAPVDGQAATTLGDAAPSHRRFKSLALVEREDRMQGSRI